MNYWNMQLHPNDPNWHREEELLKKHGVIGLGVWEEESNQQSSFQNVMQVGDYVVIKHGGTIIALTQVIGDYYYDENTDDLLWFERRRKVKVLDMYDDSYNYSVPARRTLERYASPEKDGYKSVVDWINKLKKRDNMKKIIKLLTSNKNIILSGAPGTGKTYLAKNIAEKMGATEEHQGFVQFHPSYDYTDFIEGLRPIHKEGSNEIGFERKDGVFMEFCRKALASPKEIFVFIIDEINRGEISKIFGELFFSIDPGYRGEKGKVFTQYSNLWKEEDYYDTKQKGDERKKFYVPENVYIIGTMNDIDRSVESMDFAFRRRFAFKEIKASENTGMLDELGNEDLKKNALRRMELLNNEISQCPGLNSSYHIGASYFLKLNNYKEEPSDEKFIQLWDNHLETLLKEYLRGLPDADELLEKMRMAYFGTNAKADDNEAAN